MLSLRIHKNTSGIRDLEQAAEHIAANALYQIEVDHLTGVTFNAEMVRGVTFLKKVLTEIKVKRILSDISKDKV